MKANPSDNLLAQVGELIKQWELPFPYADSRTVLAQIKQNEPAHIKRYADFIPDLDTYFFMVYTYGSGASGMQNWSTQELVKAQSLLKRSFYQMHTKYAPLEWMVNQINTPTLYHRLSLSNQIRQLLLRAITQKIASKTESNRVQQKQVLATLS